MNGARASNREIEQIDLSGYSLSGVTVSQHQVTLLLQPEEAGSIGKLTIESHVVFTGASGVSRLDDPSEIGRQVIPLIGKRIEGSSGAGLNLVLAFDEGVSLELVADNTPYESYQLELDGLTLVV